MFMDTNQKWVIIELNLIIIVHICGNTKSLLLICFATLISVSTLLGVLDEYPSTNLKIKTVKVVNRY